MARTAAALIIGNEILTGKIQEGNVRTLGQELFRLGVSLRRIVVCPDEPETIAADLRALSESHDMVFTSGGVGPTHDDVTVAAVAKAFGRPVVRNARIEGSIREHWGSRVTEEHLRMADLPEGAELIEQAEVPWPVICVENVYVLPGVPEIFRMELAQLRDRIGADQPFISRALFTLCDEGEIAALLERVERRHPGVAIGSYPRFRDPSYRVKLTFDGTSGEAVDAALEDCASALDADKIVRRE